MIHTYDESGVRPIPTEAARRSNKMTRCERSNQIVGRLENLFLAGYDEREIFEMRKRLVLSGRQCRRYLDRVKAKMIGDSDGGDFEKVLLQKRLDFVFRAAVESKNLIAAIECLKMKMSRRV